MLLPDNKKLTIIFSLEKSCLGPNDNEPIDQFCRYAMRKIKLGSEGYITWSVIPKAVSLDKEVAYRLNNKALLPDQAAQYVERLGGNLKDIEADFFSKTVKLIDIFLEYKLEK